MKIIINTKQSKILEQNLRRSYNDPSQAPSDYLGPKGYLGAKQTRDAQKRSFQISYDESVKKFKCIPGNVLVFVSGVINKKEELKQQLGVDDATLLFLLKAAIATMGRESDYGEISDYTDQASEFLHTWNMGWLSDFGQDVYNFTLRRDDRQSLGAGQFTEKTWNEYGLDKKIGPFGKNFGISKQGLAIMYRLIDDYRTAIKNGAGTGPSENQIAVRQGKIKGIAGTGNNAWDLAIVAHNQGPWLLTSFCKTSNPDYNAPCSRTTWEVPTPKGKEVLTVKKNEKVPNYFPNAGSKQVPAIGYIEEVTSRMRTYSCLTL